MKEIKASRSMSFVTMAPILLIACIARSASLFLVLTGVFSLVCGVLNIQFPAKNGGYTTQGSSIFWGVFFIVAAYLLKDKGI